MTRKKAVLLVEGHDDAAVCNVLRRAHGIAEPAFEIKAHSGVDALLRAFSLALEDAAYGRVGTVVDADVDSAARWRSIRSSLTALGYERVPEEPDPDGTVVAGPAEDRPLAGVWIMPDNRLPGILEDFVRFLVPEGDDLIARAEVSVDDIPPESRRFPDARRSKAVIHTWLAWQEEPGKPMGQALTARYLDADREHGRRLAGWCRRLFLDG
jgi:hypothetical protein